MFISCGFKTYRLTAAHFWENVYARKYPVKPVLKSWNTVFSVSSLSGSSPSTTYLAYMTVEVSTWSHSRSIFIWRRRGKLSRNA